jgi:hypothetical protein
MHGGGQRAEGGIDGRPIPFCSGSGILSGSSADLFGRRPIVRVDGLFGRSYSLRGQSCGSSNKKESQYNDTDTAMSFHVAKFKTNCVNLYLLPALL